MNEVGSPQEQDTGLQRWGRHLAGLAVGAIVYFGGKEIGLGEPVAVLAGLVGAMATNSIVGHYQLKSDAVEYPPHRHLDM